MSKYYNESISARRDYLASIIEEKEKALASAPPGTLRVNNKGNNSYFYCVTEKHDTKGRYLNSQNKQLISALAQKDYDQRILRAAGNEIKLLDRLLKLEGNLVEDIYGLLLPARQKLVYPVDLTDDEFIRRWIESKTCEPMGFGEDDPIILTTEGYRVRSKSEQLWADTFERLGVPHVFEPKLYLKGHGWVRPDFAGLNVRKRKEIIIEHLGMMDEIGYSNKNVSKIHDYERNGFILGDNLLITLETKRHPPEVKAIENLIKKHFL